MKQVIEIVETISELSDDLSTPKNLKSKLVKISKLLNQNLEDSLNINKALDELDEIVNENNLEPYTRSQIWNIVSMLERI